MKEESVEYFYGTKEEINNERLRKLDLMSNFPKRLGTVDWTRYVVVDDDKAQPESLYDDNTVATPGVAFSSAVISGGSEKSKEQRNSQPSCVPGFENRENSPNFSKGKEVTTFLTPKKDNTETTAPRPPFDFDDNTTNPFNLNPQYRKLRRVNGNNLHTTGVGIDSLGLKSDKIENLSNSLKTGNINYNTNTDSNNATTTKPDIKPGLYGRNPERDYTEELNKLKKQLPPIAASILENSGAKIIVLDNMCHVDNKGNITNRNGRYYANKNEIYLDSRHVDKYTLLSEAIHVAQDYLNMTGKGNSNLEFQEHVIKDLYFKQLYTITKDYEDYKYHFNSTDGGYDDFIKSVFDENNILDLNRFLSNINYFFADFQENYKPSNSYQTPAVKDFNYNWIKMLHIFGIEFKY